MRSDPLRLSPLSLSPPSPQHHSLCPGPCRGAVLRACHAGRWVSRPKRAQLPCGTAAPSSTPRARSGPCQVGVAGAPLRARVVTGLGARTGFPRARQPYLLGSSGELGSTGVEGQRSQRTVVSGNHVGSSLVGESNVTTKPTWFAGVGAQESARGDSGSSSPPRGS